MNELRQMLANGTYMTYEEFRRVLDMREDPYSEHLFFKFQEAASLLRQFRLSDLQKLSQEYAHLID